MTRDPATRNSHWTALLCCLALAVPQWVAAPAGATGNNVQVCHVPPGNPDSFHTITVSENALQAHLRHGDFEGPCGDFCEILCDDGNFCTVDACDADEGCVYSAVDCNDSNSCTADTCEPERGCVASPLPGSECTIDDGNVCTTPGGTCDDGGSCVPEPVPGCCNSDEDCADSDLCTLEACFGNECVPDGETICGTDVCSVSVCHPQTGDCTDPEPATCEDDGLFCTVESCVPGSGCTSEPRFCGRDRFCDEDADACVDIGCPCWNGLPGSFGESLQEIWTRLAPATCDQLDRCVDSSFSIGITDEEGFCEPFLRSDSSSATCVSTEGGSSRFSTRASIDFDFDFGDGFEFDEGECSVGGESIRDLSRGAARACMRDHDAFTATTRLPFARCDETENAIDEMCGLPSPGAP